MAIKEVKLQKMLSKEGSSLNKAKKVEIQEMLQFLNTEMKEITNHFNCKIFILFKKINFVSITALVS